MLDKNHRANDIDLNRGEVILIDKPGGISSFDVVKRFRELYPGYVKKIGHAGTLDVMATGLLILCTGPMTKRIVEFQDMHKEYEGIMCLGGYTRSYDNETPVEKKFDTKNLDKPQIREMTLNFTGTVDQVPPSYSAVRYGRKRAYEFAREGRKIELASKKVNIYSFELLEFRMPEIKFRVQCSKGTYIRSLVHDFGKALNNGAYLISLRRTEVGDLHVNDALNLQQVEDLFWDHKFEK